VTCDISCHRSISGYVVSKESIQDSGLPYPLAFATKFYRTVGADVGTQTYAVPELRAPRESVWDVNQARLSRAAISRAVDDSLRQMSPIPFRYQDARRRDGPKNWGA
jgi:hypothetical protein